MMSLDDILKKVEVKELSDEEIEQPLIRRCIIIEDRFFTIKGYNTKGFDSFRALLIQNSYGFSHTLGETRGKKRKDNDGMRQGTEGIKENVTQRLYKTRRMNEKIKHDNVGLTLKDSDVSNNTTITLEYE